ncbi:MAG: DUF4145 domain-containing protein [Candidatus Thiodiazotropha sp. (ex Codakia rugifera)]|nr:DUF4145 domain-containing protein [Candidatus Thiodiazotropha sp. (ex Codakia rugifera)]
MDRRIYKLPFGKDKAPDWICPTCCNGVLRIMDNTFHFEERTLSKDAHSHEAWEPEWIEYVYSCLLRCSNDACGEIVANNGIGSVDWYSGYDNNETPVQEWDEIFSPRYFEPHLIIFKYPDETPPEIASEIDQSFSLFFSNPASASNHLRISLEHLLTFLKVKRQGTKKGKRFFLSLHRRINLIPIKFEGLKCMLLAVKWLGNAGSHAKKEITNDDVLDAYEIMDAVLREIFDNKSKKAKALAKKINKKKGPK